MGHQSPADVPAKNAKPAAITSITAIVSFLPHGSAQDFFIRYSMIRLSRIASLTSAKPDQGDAGSPRSKFGCSDFLVSMGLHSNAGKSSGENITRPTVNLQAMKT